jgi:hypothetical protein
MKPTQWPFPHWTRNGLALTQSVGPGCYSDAHTTGDFVWT